jgi:hypothetical protein
MKKHIYQVTDARNHDHVIGNIIGQNNGDIIRTSARQAKRLSKKCPNIVILGKDKNYYLSTCLDGNDVNVVGWL